MFNKHIPLLYPEWPAPQNVRVAISTRQGGVSLPPYHSANLGDHVGDHSVYVQQNRELLSEQLGVQDWHWLEQVHGVDVVEATSIGLTRKTMADGVYSSDKQQVCAVLTADCLPILLCDATGTQVAAVHAGWRGLAAGIIKNSLNTFVTQASEVMAYLGPAISSQHFEVGEEVLRAFIQSMGPDAERHFKPVATQKEHYMADLYALAKLNLQQQGVVQVYGGDYCTYNDEAQFFSYRRDGVTGRMVSAIWLE